MPSDLPGPSEIGLDLLFDITVHGAPATGDRGSTTWSTGRFAITLVSTPTAGLRREHGGGRLQATDCYAVCCVIDGEISGRAGLRIVRADAGDVLLLDLLEPVDLTLAGQDGVRLVIVWAPRGRIGVPGVEAQALHGHVVDGRAATGAFLAGSLAALPQHAPTASLKELDVMANWAVTMLNGVLPAVTDGARPSTTVSLDKVRAFIDLHLASPVLETDMIAGEFGLSRATLYRLFKPLGGVALYIRRQRLRRAYLELVAIEGHQRRISEIGHRWGFTDLGAFNRAFREMYGVNPKEARAAAAEGRMAGGSQEGPANLARTVAQIGA